jgi:hypothetical protein
MRRAARAAGAPMPLTTMNVTGMATTTVAPTTAPVKKSLVAMRLPPDGVRA